MFTRLIDKIRPWWALLLTSSLSLFMELAVIRWIAGEVRLLAYYKNLILLAAFLGLAIGFALVRKGRDYRFSFPALWVMFAALVLSVGMVSSSRLLVYPGGGDEFLWYSLSASSWLALISFVGIIVIFFFLVMLLFIPLGQATGEEMAPHPPVKAYIMNILASLIGIWVFSLISYLQTPPVVWFAIALIGVGIYYRYCRKLTLPTGALLAASLVGIGIFGVKTIWSPYSRLDIEQIGAEDNQTLNFGYVLAVQQSFYQTALNLSDEFVAYIQREAPAYGEHFEIAQSYNLPYRLVPPGSRVLIVGSGMGNDVAAALRGQAAHVTAVEIDPTILALGRKYHPENPYGDPRVVPINDDARSFFKESNDKFDLVVFGWLDSHTLLSSLSSVRLDSFVYTIQSFQEVKGHLDEGGIVALSFAGGNEWLEERLGRMLIEVFDENNVYSLAGNWGITFVVGNISTEQQNATGLQPWMPDQAFDDLPLPTDDWPYLYLRGHRIPAGYWQTLLLVGILSLALIARSFPEALRPLWHFWLLGAAFLLIEFKSITELALLFGTTWFVNSLAISGVLTMALLANLYVLRTPRIDIRLAYVLLFASLGLGYFFPLESLAGLSLALKGAISTLILSLPMLFAGIIFSASLREAGETARPIASNFSGSAVGGLLEYGSVWWGIKSLYLVAILIYLGAMLTALVRRKS